MNNTSKVSTVALFTVLAFVVLLQLYYSFFGISADGDFNHYLQAANAMRDKDPSSVALQWVSLGYPVLIRIVQLVSSKAIETYVHSVQLALWQLTIAFIFYTMLRLYRDTTFSLIASGAFFVLVTNFTYITFSLNTEPFYICFLSFFVLLYCLHNRSRSLTLLALSMLFLGVGIKIRSTALIGFYAPILIWHVYLLLKDRNALTTKSLAIVIACPLFVFILFSLFVQHGFHGKFPKRSSTVYLTQRVLTMDGICEVSNGPYSSTLLGVDEMISKNFNRVPKKGSVYMDKETYSHFLNTFGEKQTRKIYFRATVECIAAHPWTWIRNTAINMASYIANINFLNRRGRSLTGENIVLVNAPEWSNLDWLLLSFFSGVLVSPYCIVLLAFIGIPSLRKTMNPATWFIVFFVFTEISVTSLLSEYSLRHALPSIFFSLLFVILTNTTFTFKTIILCLFLLRPTISILSWDPILVPVAKNYLYFAISHSLAFFICAGYIITRRRKIWGYPTPHMS